MSNDQTLAQYRDELNRYVEEHIPSIKHAGAELVAYDELELIIAAPLSLNHNDHGNAFGGSLYNLALMAGWATLFFECRKHVEKPNIVTRDGQIRYRHPVSDNMIRVSCRIPSARQWDGFFAHYEKTGKTTLTLSSTIMSGNDIAARFDGVFVLLDE